MGRKRIETIVTPKGTGQVVRLGPSYKQQVEIWKTLKDDVDYIIEVYEADPDEKNYRGQLEAIIRFAFDTWPTDQYKNRSQIWEFRQHLKIECGFVKTYIINKKAITECKSFSPRKTGHKKFLDQAYNPILDFIGDTLGMTREELIEASQDYWGYQKRV
jgi:hypothetical protein